MLKIDQKIVSVSLPLPLPLSSVAKADAVKPPSLQVINENLARPKVLEGRTYKLKTPLSSSSMYLTMNDIVLNKGTAHEVRRPFEIFINSKEMRNYQWVVSLTMLLSAIYRKGGDVTFILDELKSVFDPNGGYLTKGGYVPSLVAEIGLVIEEHFKYIGLVHIEEDVDLKAYISEKKQEHLAQGGTLVNAKLCPNCLTMSVVKAGGCDTCLECGDSKCS